MIINFVYRMANPSWHCRIGRINLKAGVSMHVPFICGDDWA